MIHDPKVDPRQIRLELGLNPNENEQKINEVERNSDGGWRFSEDIYESFKNSDACLILTEWDQYSVIDWNKASNIMDDILDLSAVGSDYNVYNISSIDK